MGKYDQLVDAAVLAYRERLVAAVQQLGEVRNPGEFCDAERMVHGLTVELSGDLTQRVLQQVSDDAQRGREALARVRERAAGRGMQVRVERARTTQVRTLSGVVVEIRTPYASAKPRGNGGPLSARGAPGSGVYPVLDELGIAGRSTPALRMHVSRNVCEANSVTSARDLLASGGLEIDHKAALRLTYMVCEVALEARLRAVETAQDNPLGEFAGKRLVAAVDGGRVLIRRRTAGRPKNGGRKHFVTEWREPKVLTIYALGPDGKRDRSFRSVIDGTLGDADAVFNLLRYHLLRLGASAAQELTLVGDGAVWIWNRAEELRNSLGLPEDRFHEVVDYFHAVERLGELSHTQARWAEEARLAWVADQKGHLKAGRVEDVERAVKALRYKDRDARKTALDYWSRNRARLRYATFRERALPLGSGAVESSVRRVINLRLKGASIAWTEEHAEGVLHLRAHAKSGRWAELERVVLANTGWQPTSCISRERGAA